MPHAPWPLLPRPLHLELDLFLAVAALMLDVEPRADGHRDALPGDLDFEALAPFQRVGEAAQLGMNWARG